jgi:hypothetical protein
MHSSFKLMGCPVRDVVTGIEGICDSICFDLYGCIQASVRPQGLDDKGSPKASHWYDVKRLVATGEPVMAVPDFSKPEIGSASKSPR